jgi:hypothetical protein
MMVRPHDNDDAYALLHLFGDILLENLFQSYMPQLLLFVGARF